MSVVTTQGTLGSGMTRNAMKQNLDEVPIEINLYICDQAEFREYWCLHSYPHNPILHFDSGKKCNESFAPCGYDGDTCLCVPYQYQPEAAEDSITQPDSSEQGSLK